MGYYKLHDPKRGVLGPIRLELVRELIAMGTVGPDVRFARNSGPFLPRQSFEELEVLVGSAPPLENFEGNLKSRTFFSVFYELFLKRATGLLSVRRGGHNKDVFLEQGHPVFAASNIENERFGSYLVSRGELSPKALEDALDVMTTSGDSLGVTLIKTNVMEEPDVIAALRDQQIMRLVDLCAWDDGELTYFDEQRYVGEKFDLRLDAAELLVRAARDLPESILLDRLGKGKHQRVELSPDVSLEETEFKLTPTERTVLSQLDGSSTLTALLGRFTDNPQRRRSAIMVVYLLWEAGLLTFHAA
ncbi:MAG: DUF4388 domain-containing protein [Myxococcota bacterium]